MSDEYGPSDPKTRHRRDNELGELSEARVALSQRRREAEPRQIDHVRRVPQCAQRADLRRDRERRGAHAWQEDRVRSIGRTAAADPDAVTTVLDDGLLHGQTLC